MPAVRVRVPARRVSASEGVAVGEAVVRAVDVVLVSAGGGGTRKRREGTETYTVIQVVRGRGGPLARYTVGCAGGARIHDVPEAVDWCERARG